MMRRRAFSARRQHDKMRAERVRKRRFSFFRNLNATDVRLWRPAQRLSAICATRPRPRKTRLPRAVGPVAHEAAQTQRHRMGVHPCL